MDKRIGAFFAWLGITIGALLASFSVVCILIPNDAIDYGTAGIAIITSKLSNKTGRNFSMTYLLIGFNACVYLAVFLLINRNAALMSLLVYVVATSVINHFTDRFEAVKQVTMITQDAKGLADAIREELGKTCTIMNSYGLIYGENKTVICYVNYFELPKIKEIISRQGGAFTTISTIDEIVR